MFCRTCVLKKKSKIEKKQIKAIYRKKVDEIKTIHEAVNKNDTETFKKLLQETHFKRPKANIELRVLLQNPKCNPQFVDMFVTKYKQTAVLSRMILNECYENKPMLTHIMNTFAYDPRFMKPLPEGNRYNFGLDDLVAYTDCLRLYNEAFKDQTEIKERVLFSMIEHDSVNVLTLCLEENRVQSFRPSQIDPGIDFPPNIKDDGGYRIDYIMKGMRNLPLPLKEKLIQLVRGNDDQSQIYLHTYGDQEIRKLCVKHNKMNFDMFTMLGNMFDMDETIIHNLDIEHIDQIGAFYKDYVNIEAYLEYISDCINMCFVTYIMFGISIDDRFERMVENIIQDEELDTYFSYGCYKAFVCTKKNQYIDYIIEQWKDNKQNRILDSLVYHIIEQNKNVGALRKILSNEKFDIRAKNHTLIALACKLNNTEMFELVLDEYMNNNLDVPYHLLKNISKPNRNLIYRYKNHIYEELIRAEHPQYKFLYEKIYAAKTLPDVPNLSQYL